jgi:hypothetical protein
MKISKPSPLTGAIRHMEIDITENQIKAWQSGTMIQEAMPNISDDEREFLLSGLTPEEWNEMFKE